MSPSDEITAFQVSPEGKAYTAIYDMQNAIDDLTSAPPDIIAKYWAQAEISTAIMKLGSLLAIKGTVQCVS